jgi:signal transduction histidine kinase
LRAYFLANVSHEFRTPLSTLNASLELLMDESGEKSGSEDVSTTNQMISAAEMRALLKPIHLSLLELQTLIDNLLEGGTIEAGEFRLRKREMTLNEAITGALTVVQPMLERRRQSISVTEPANLGLIWGDRVRLTQVLVNLLANASKYTPMGEAIEITVERTHAGPTAGGYRVCVADRGPGIPHAERVNLFRRFVRLETSHSAAGDGVNHKADVHGTGLGLYVVKTSIEAHGGRVGIEDRGGGGSVFWFEVPKGNA